MSTRRVLAYKIQNNIPLTPQEEETRQRFLEKLRDVKLPDGFYDEVVNRYTHCTKTDEKLIEDIMNKKIKF